MLVPPVRTLICPLFHPSRRRAIPSGCPDRPSIIRPDDVDFRPDPLLYWEAFVPACIRSNFSAARPDASQYLTKLQILSKFIYGKIDATVRTTWIPVRTRFSLRHELQFKFNRPDACASNMEIADLTSTVRTTIPHVLDGWKPLWRPTSPGNVDVFICINAPFMTTTRFKAMMVMNLSELRS